MRLLLASLLGLGLAACETAPVDTYAGAVIAVPAAMETAPMTGRGDRADDPALWVSASDPSLVRILGTNKDEGLHVYDLDGRELQVLPVGPVNNVDLRGDLAVASNDGTNALSWFGIDAATGEVSHLGDTPVQTVEPYGVCAGFVDDTDLAAVTYKTGEVELWAPVLAFDGTLRADLIRTVKLETQLEGCVFDDEARRLFIGEEGHGVWSLDLADPESALVAVDTIASGKGLIADVEGLSLWLGEGGAGYLVVSAQSADRFVVYDRQPPHAVRGVITVAGDASGAIDPVTHTDGLEASSRVLPGYPRGVLIVQDDGNPASGVDQNFKLVDWRAVEAALSLPSAKTD